MINAQTVLISRLVIVILNFDIEMFIITYVQCNQKILYLVCVANTKTICVFHSKYAV